MGRAALACLIALLGLVVVGFCDVTKHDRRTSHRDARYSGRDSRKDTVSMVTSRKDTHAAAGSRRAHDNYGRHFDTLRARHDRTHALTSVPLECPEVPAGYTFYPGLDSPGSDEGYLLPLDVADVADLTEACNEDPLCVGFNSNGWLKYQIAGKENWVIWTEDPCLGLYVLNAADRSRSDRSRMKDTTGDSECPEVPADYLFFPFVDSYGNDIEFLGALDVADLAAACDEDPDCYGFNSNGWIKYWIDVEEEWVTWTEDPCLGLYVYAPGGEDRNRRDGKFSRRDGKFSRHDGKISRRDGKFSRRDGKFNRRDGKFIGHDRHDRNYMG